MVSNIRIVFLHSNQLLIFKKTIMKNILLAIAVIVIIHLLGNDVDKQLASDVNQKPIVMFNMSEEERDYNLQVDTISNDTIFVSPIEIK